jgi:hypothetical protein
MEAPRSTPSLRIEGDSAPADEAEQVRERYGRRTRQDPRYDLRNPSALAALQERQRAMLRLFGDLGLPPLGGLRLLEAGSGDGGNLLDFIRWGFAPSNLGGIELLPERHAAAQARLPAGVRLMQGDATLVLAAATTDNDTDAHGQDIAAGPWPSASQDIVFQSTVFSSLLDDVFQHRLADALWRAVRPGGGVLWYDFTVDNPRNPDVRGVPLRRVQALFPQARFDRFARAGSAARQAGAPAARSIARRVTLAPPIARSVCRLHPALYTWFNALPALRTHLLCWLAKPLDPDTDHDRAHR